MPSPLAISTGSSPPLLTSSSLPHLRPLTWLTRNSSSL
ncbi:hypothetical protein LINPERHAP2_LOCUS6179 [Linum perenne]